VIVKSSQAQHIYNLIDWLQDLRIAMKYFYLIFEMEIKDLFNKLIKIINNINNNINNIKINKYLMKE
jgi:transposase